MKKSILFCFLILIFVGEQVSAQSVQLARKYRVIAVKNGNPGITSMSNETVVTPSMYIYIPNAFTPNGDGINDYFAVSGESIQTFSMQIFNRWGELIFESKDASSGWDGLYKGKPAPQGTYVYKVIASGISGKKSAKEGSFNLIL